VQNSSAAAHELSHNHCNHKLADVSCDGHQPNGGLPAICSQESSGHKQAAKCDFDGEIHPLPKWALGKWSLKLHNRLLLGEMINHVTTDFAIYCQWDGFAINPQHWTDEFLHYDYIGAPWMAEPPPYHPTLRVGNGGISVRSKRWLEACSTLKDKTSGHEDARCCCWEIDHFLDAGCVIAPLELAVRFSFEHPIPEYPSHTINDSFGFHGPHHFRTREDLVMPTKE